MADDNKNPEQIARDAIDARLAASAWSVQSNKKIDLSERKYGAWPTAIREGFEAARTVKPGKPTFRLVLGEAR